MAISDRLNKLTTDITNAYTSIENKGGTIPANKNTNNLPTAIDSIEVIETATAEDESLSLTNTKAMPYKDYKVKGKSVQNGTPSPSIPSDINSVADDVNLFDGNANTINSGTIKTIINTGVRITLSSSGTFRYSGIEIGGAELLGKTITLYSTITPSSNNDGAIFLYYGNSSNMAVSAVNGGGLTNTGSKTITIANEFPTNCDRIYGLFYANRNGTGNTNDYVDYTNLKIQYGDTATPYSPYNQGTVTIKQENIKNYLNWDKFIDYSNWTNSNSPGYKSFEITGLNINKTYTLYRTDIAGYGETSKYAGFNKGNNNGNMFLHSTDSSRNLQSVSDTPSEDGKIYITMYMSSQSDLNDYINIIKKCWVIEGNDYEPYQANDYTFQTEPLRSLPNGVKDTIEAEQHRKIGKQTGTLTETTTITLSDAKTNGAYMCNIKPSGTLTGQTIELEAGDYEIIYELEEEIIEPLTQNQATTMLDIIKTGSYEGTTNIYTDEDVKPTIGVGYYKKG